MPKPAKTPASPTRSRDPEATRANILKAATREFASVGLGGGRIDRIAEKSGANKRMIYHYFGSKEALFSAVVVAAYRDIRLAERKLKLQAMSAVEALEAFIEFTWRYYLRHPEFITLVNSENLHRARHIKGNETLRELQRGHVELVGEIVRRGQAEGTFRADIDVPQLCISIAAIAFYYLNNHHTGSALFDRNLMSQQALAERLAFNKTTIVRLVSA